MEFDSDKNYITTPEALKALVTLVKKAKIMALDTEFTRRTTYYPILSIIQVGVMDAQKKKHLFIIDPATGLDLKIFYKLIASSRIIKILHSCAQDLQIFHKDSGLMPKAIIDTQIMANFCGLGFSVGYSRLVEDLFDEILDKGPQKSNWQIRPLSQSQIEYAVMDVFYLEEIYEQFKVILKEKKRAKWFVEDVNSFIEKTLLRTDENLSKNFAFRGKTAKEITQINHLVLLREKWARKLDKPRQHVIKDEVIDDLVMGRKVSVKVRKEVMRDMRAMLDKKEKYRDKNDLKEGRSIMNAEQKNTYLEAKKLLNKVARAENLKEQVLITSSDLKQVICDKKLFKKTLGGWRLKLFGKELKKIIY